MRALYILTFGAAALVAASCGARTPFDELETAGAGGTTGQTTTSTGSGATTGTTSGGPVTTTTGQDSTTTGPNTTGPNTTGSSGVTSGTTSGSTTGSSTSSVTTSGGPTSGSTSGVGGSFTTGSGSGTTTTGNGPVGSGGFTVTTTTGGTGGRAGAGGSGGTAGRDAGPPDASTVNPLLGILPGVQPTPQCNQCVNTRCNGTSSCSSDPACVGGVACYFTACWLLPNQNQQIACALKCFNGNLSQAMAASNAVTCVYGSCSASCLGGRGGGRGGG